MYLVMLKSIWDLNKKSKINTDKRIEKNDKQYQEYLSRRLRIEKILFDKSKPMENRNYIRIQIDYKNMR